ncbi:MAG TPA: hypothetical protein VGM01_00975 [Ktedonobacteraceae bacterium]
MQQPPYDQSTRSLRAGRTNPSLPSVRLPTTPVYVPAAPRQRWPQLATGRRVSPLRRVFWQFMLFGFLLILCFWLLFPLFGDALPGSFVAQALPRAFPWLVDFSWTRLFPGFVALLSRVPWLDLQASSPVGFANLALMLLGIAGLLLLLATNAARFAAKERLPKGPMRLLLLVVCLFTLLFGVMFALLPGNVSQAALLSGLYGRLILIYHANPYLVSAGSLAGDPFYRALTPGSFVSPLAGPLWLDLTVLPAWLAQNSPVTALLTFRAIGLGLHILNALLLWSVLAKLKPETRLTGTLFYAWNPAILLLGMSEAQMDLATIFFLLLGAFLMQRRSLLLSWTCFALAALINPLCLLLLPLFLRALHIEMRQTSRGGRTLHWLLYVLLFAVIVVLAYAPYWSGLGINGIILHLGTAFWQNGAQSSLLAALSKLPFATWPPTGWLLVPSHWLFLPAVIVGGLLLLGIWIIDTLELALLFGSWIFLALFILLPVNAPWLILLPLALALASSSRRTALLAHLLAVGALVAYCLAYWPDHWSGLALVTIGLVVIIWGWTLFFLSTWQMTHHEDEDEEQPTRKRVSLSRPTWPSRPAAWPSRPGSRRP